MANVKSAVTRELHHTLETHPQIEEVHFTADGHHHFRVFTHGNGRYTRLEEVPEVTKSGISTGKFVQVPIKDLSGKDDERFAIVETVSREDVLKTTPVSKTVVSDLSKLEAVAATLEVSQEDLVAFLKSRNTGAPIVAKKK